MARATAPRAGWPEPADFAPPPDARTRERWAEADRAARAVRLERLRSRLAGAGLDGYFGARREHMRWLCGFALADGEEKVAGHSGQFLATGDDVTVLADSRYTIQARREAPEATIVDVGYDLPGRWRQLLEERGVRRIGLEAVAVSHALWRRLESAAPDVEHVPIEGWLEAERARKTPEELERIAAACAVADRALASLLAEIRAGATEQDLALRLEWLMRTGGAEALAFDVACLSGPEAALPHGSPGDRPVRDGAVLLFDFGAQVEGYRSDMTRTLFVGEPTGRDLAAYELVLASQSAAIDAVTASVRAAAADGTPMLSGRAADAAARSVIEAAGHGEHFGHGTGHGIGLATHEDPRLSRVAPETPLPSPTVFSVEPGVYLEGETGVRIEDLVAIDAEAGRVERLTRFPRDVVVVGG
ncbi:MAG TPA: Xaa-Pro peptidase family protein [Candidatus Limnocylindrales bacterium]|nr:Xaa-Pro peptidase family protein [Candidatus Limnocylindrales bacterium]